MDYATLVNGLNAFIDRRPVSGIRFLYFNTNDLATPLVKTSLRRWKVKNTWCFIAPGSTANFCYVYRKSTMRYMVSARFVGEAKTIVDNGDHLTFGIKKGVQNTIVLNTHKTIYSENQAVPFTFDRDSSRACNVIAPPATANITRGDFTALKCYGKRSIMEDEYADDPFIIDIIYNLYNVIYQQSGGGKRKYIQKGGEPLDYKGVTFISDTFIKFLSEKIFQPVYDLRPDLASIQVFFDELNELGADANQNIIILYDFAEDTRNIFHIQMNTAFAAAYANEHPTIANAFEKRCLRQFIESAAHPVTGIRAVVMGGAGAGVRR